MERIMSQVAMQYGTTPQEVQKEILKALTIAMYSDDSTACNHWDKLFIGNRRPTTEEVLTYMCKLVKERLT
ncbi:MAG: hypothetical protein IKL00_11735 [Oscillospiraceae bacterium]|nr:hypothetical protein [Oscillospiraceae bacterium]